MKIAYRTSLERRQTSRDRRETLRAANRCINGPLDGTVGARGVEHGAVVASGRCRRCLDVKEGRAA